MSRRGAINAALRRENIPTIMAFCEDAGLEWKYIAGDWHIRIENILDIFPTRKRYHYLPTGERGNYKDYDHIGQILINREESES